MVVEVTIVFLASTGTDDGDYIDGVSIDTLNTIGMPTDSFYTNNSFMIVM